LALRDAGRHEDQLVRTRRTEVPLLIDCLNLGHKRIATTQPDAMTSYDWIACRFTGSSIVFFNEELNTAKADKK